MKVLKYLSFAVLLLCLASCGKGDENSVTLKVETELGPLADYIKVTDQEVVVKMSDEKEDGADCKVITSSLALEVIKSVASNHSFYFDVVVLDKDHVEIGTLPYFNIESISDYDNGDLTNVLLAGSLRAQMKDSDKVAEITPEDQEEMNKIFKEGVYIVIKPNDPNAKFEEYKGKSSSAEVVESSDDTIAEDDQADSSSASSQDWDAMLDSYEEYVDNYISLLKKAANGDRSAMAEYPALMKKAQEFGNEMKNAQGSMSASQLARYTKISTKMLKAAQEMR